MALAMSTLVMNVTTFDALSGFFFNVSVVCAGETWDWRISIKISIYFITNQLRDVGEWRAIQSVNIQDELLLNFHKQIKSVIQKLQLWPSGLHLISKC